MIGKLSIPIVNAAFFYVMISFKEQEYFYFDYVLPLLFSALCSFLVSRIFFGLGDEIILAFMMCIAVDIDLNLKYNNTG